MLVGFLPVSLSLALLALLARPRRLGSARGIRQGAPISPYLFIIIMQVFSFLMNDRVDRGHITPFKCNNFRFSHADDCILAFRGNKRSLKYFTEMLSSFTAITGLKIQIDKSAVYFYKWAKPYFRRAVRDSLGIRKGTFAFKY